MFRGELPGPTCPLATTALARGARGCPASHVLEPSPIATVPPWPLLLSSLPVAGFQPQEPFAVLGDHCLDTQSQKGFLSTLPVNLMFSEQIFFGQACRTPSSLTRGIMQCVLTNTMWAPGHLNLWSGPSGPLSVRTQLASLNLIIFVLSR